MKARVRIDLPPGTILTRDTRAALVSAVEHHLDCDECSDLEKAEREPKKLPHRAPQTWIDEATKLYREAMPKMLDEIAAALAE